MKKIRPAAAAGSFYTNGKLELTAQLDYFEENNIKDYDYKTRAVIVPHAGYIYSGQLASNGFQYLDKNVKNIFIIAPPHYVSVRDAALSSFKWWSTPLGDIEVNQEINKELTEIFGCSFHDEAFLDEHSAEVQVPFIQKYIPHAKIIPILVSKREKIERIIDYYWPDPENAFIISSDLSHFHNSARAREIDNSTAEIIEGKNIGPLIKEYLDQEEKVEIEDKITADRACGAIGVSALVNFVHEKGYSLIRIGMINSGDITGDNSRVVGYGSWILYEGAKNAFIKKYFSEFVINTCKKSILAGLHNEIPLCEKTPAVFSQLGACFVTLERKGVLRGCIGSIIAHRSLADDLIKNAQSSAFADPRFQPVRQDELEDLSINVSILSDPEEIEFVNESDLLTQIKPFVDGIIIKERSYQAVYLPSVWEQLPDKKLFLNSLKVKAGLTENYFSQTFEAYRFTTEYIEG